MKKQLSNVASAIIFIFWLSIVVKIINPFNLTGVILYPQQSIHLRIYMLVISSLLLSVFLLYRGYKILIETSQQSFIQIKRNDKRRIKFLITLLIPILTIVPIVYAYVYEQDNTNLTQMIIDLVLMDEDFDDVPPGTDPPGWQEGSGNWTAVDDGGNIVYYQDDDRDQESLSIPTIGNVSWANYTFSVDIKFVEGNTKKDDRGALLLFRYNGGNDYYFLWLKEYLDELAIYNHGGWGRGNLVATTSYTLIQDTWYHVNITIVGQIVDVTINGTAYFSNVNMNGPEETGNVAIGTRYYKVMFDNIYVEVI